MWKILMIIALAMLSTLTTIANATEQTIKLSVPGMTCASCPYMVTGAISELDGIKAVESTMKDRSATVTFDDALTNAEEIKQATANIGYPSTLFDVEGDS